MHELNTQWLEPSWPAPQNVRSLISTRRGGSSHGRYASNNLGLHVGDEPASVFSNRQQLNSMLPSEPCWLQQVHGTCVYELGEILPKEAPEADACYTKTPCRVCSVLTADCLPILLCSADAQEVAAVHAGWRGLAAGVVSAAVEQFHSPPSSILAYLGPAISALCFEVGSEVKSAFCRAQEHRAYATAVENAFTPSAVKGKFYADLKQLARSELVGLGVRHVFTDDYCTFRDDDQFFSFRRDGVTGRMASVIWLN